MPKSRCSGEKYIAIETLSPSRDRPARRPYPPPTLSPALASIIPAASPRTEGCTGKQQVLTYTLGFCFADDIPTRRSIHWRTVSVLNSVNVATP